jgi:hypothetical protein
MTVTSLRQRKEGQAPALDKEGWTHRCSKKGGAPAEQLFLHSSSLPLLKDSSFAPQGNSCF